MGIVALIAFAWAISENRRAISLRRVAVGLAITFVLALIFLKIPLVRAAFTYANYAFDAVAAATRAGTSFVFG